MPWTVSDDAATRHRAPRGRCGRPVGELQALLHPGFQCLRVPARADWVAGVVWRSGGRRRAVAYAAVLLILLAAATRVGAKTSHDGWPRIDGMLLMNKDDSSRPLDARPGHDPFEGQDPTYNRPRARCGMAGPRAERRVRAC